MIKQITFIFSLLVSISYADDIETTRTTVYVDMVADLFHAGHIAFLKKAKNFGDYLIVGIHSDTTVASYKRNPIETLEERVTVVEACSIVDEVVKDAPLIVTKEFLDKHNIDLVVHGDDWDNEKISTYYGDAKNLDKLRIVPYTEGISTTDIINRVKKRIKNELYSDIIKDFKSYLSQIEINSQ